jgi:hypothetical protein
LIEKIEFVEVEHAFRQGNDGIAFFGNAVYEKYAVLTRGADATCFGSWELKPLSECIAKAYAAPCR